MSNQGKCPQCNSTRVDYECHIECKHCEETFVGSCQLRDRLTTAETAATEYAQQAAELQEEVERLRAQELQDLEITIDSLLPVELQEKWGLEKLDHARNVQHIFMRACCAILELEKAGTK